MSRIPFRTRLGLELMRLYRATQARLHDLTYLFWECTLRCNLRCRHCGSDCRVDSHVPDMPRADFLRVVDELRGHVDPHRITIALTGGEPLMREDLERCGRELYRRGFPWGMVTNGYVLTAERLDALVDSGLRSMTVSLDGLADTHDWLRGRNGSYARALQAIRLAVKEKGIGFDVVTCVNQRNFDQLFALRDLLAAEGVREWRLFTIFAKGRAAENSELRLSPKQLRELLEFIDTTRKSGTVNASYGCEGFLGAYEGRARRDYFFCRAGINVGSVLADGSISACPSLRGDYVQGTIYRDSFWQVWNCRFEKMRDRRWARRDECASCRVWKWCHGSGLHLRDERTGRLMMCHYRVLEESAEVGMGRGCAGPDVFCSA